MSAGLESNALEGATILLLPGLYNSGPGHWQTHWEAMLPNAKRVQQQKWDSPCRSDWVATLDAAIETQDGPVILAAHSLGCALTVWWAAEHGHKSHAEKVRGALLVAPPDVERDGFSAFASGFAPMPRAALPFPAIVAASSDDPWCDLVRAQSWAADWRARFCPIGAQGHINADSGLHDWPQGRRWLAQLASG
ncbi:RBBP9/YdeN family alpha/beta hydrolase [Noviherbaspirillum massiliense]|uniref:RBBP9/YdeN family alpha/beta hydrolase n=1 Tax=Noviherbaspirillum massiliense TaxID=1465823 RepID=UPI0002E7CA06|nr:alpha/beta hydrolase [Noviherbaspirillum massiliense]